VPKPPLFLGDVAPAPSVRSGNVCQGTVKHTSYIGPRQVETPYIGGMSGPSTTSCRTGTYRGYHLAINMLEKSCAPETLVFRVTGSLLPLERKPTPGDRPTPV
jgi:hypothetical protein